MSTLPLLESYTTTAPNKIETIFLVGHADHSLAWHVLFPDAYVRTFAKPSDALAALNAGARPNVVVTDCQANVYELEIERFELQVKTNSLVPNLLDADSWGTRNVANVLEWYKEHAPQELPAHIIFESQDSALARIAAERTVSYLAENSGQGSPVVLGVEREETDLAISIQNNGPLPDSFAGLKNHFRLWLNQFAGFSLPTTKQELTRYKIERTQSAANPQTTLELLRGGFCSRDFALSNLQGVTIEHAARIGMGHARVNPEGTVCFSFNERSGKALQGYAAFDVQEVKRLEQEGKPPILITRAYTEKLLDVFNSVSGLVITDPIHGGHLRLLLDGHGISGLLALDEPEEELFGTVQTGDPVTLTDHALCTGHWPIVEVDTTQHPWLSEVQAHLKDWHTDTGVERLKIKVTLDKPAKTSDPFLKTLDGIGLVRTEHLILIDETARNAYRDLIQQKSPSSAGVLAERTKAAMQELFYPCRQGFPIRIRLADLGTNDMFAHSRGSLESDVRGVQLAIQNPLLYEAQLHGIFAALTEPTADEEMYRAFLDEEQLVERKVGLEILVPTVRTVDELLFVKDMASKVAEQYGIPQDAYKFGSMLETVDAVHNIESIAPHCAFLSIGSNDLTSEVLDCPRDDFIRRAQIQERSNSSFDPFVHLYPSVVDVIRDTAARARAVNPTIGIDLCGAHAADGQSLEALRAIGINGISVTPNPKNLVALPLLYGFQTFRKKVNTTEIQAQSPK